MTSGRVAVRPSTIVLGAGTAAAAATIWLAVVLFHPSASTGAGPAAPHSTGSTEDRSTDEHASGATMTTGRDVVEARFTA